MQALREVIISITNRCNLRCRMCDIPRHREAECASEDWRRAISDAAALGAKTVVFSGGEPLLREDIFELIACVKSKGMGACLTSNGLLINGDVARRFRDLGVDVVNVSVEGPRSIHDALRGEGAFEKAIRALEHLRQHKVESTIATMVSSHNYAHLKEVVGLAKTCGATTIKFQPFSTIFLDAAKDTKGFFVPASSREELETIMEEVAQLCLDSGIATNPRGYLAGIPAYLTGGLRQRQAGCNALFASCPINSRGQIYPCWVLTHKQYLIGDIRREGLASAWGSRRRADIVEKIRRSGCPGCMMSCYDEGFGADGLETRVMFNMRKIRKEGFLAYARGFLRRWAKRIAFYRTYRGSLKGIAAKLRGLWLRRGGQSRPEADFRAAAIGKVLQEIEIAKEMIAKEAGSCPKK